MPNISTQALSSKPTVFTTNVSPSHAPTEYPYHAEPRSKRVSPSGGRRQKGVLAFVVQDAETRVFRYANAKVRKEDQNDEILRFFEFWKTQTGRLPEELVFDSRLTAYANQSELNRMGIAFITLRRRSPQMLQAIREKPAAAWRRIELDNVGRIYRTPRILDETSVFSIRSGLTIRS